MTDLINDTPKGSPLLYLRDDKLKETLNNFFLVYKNFENQILENATDNNLGIADIRCILVILLYPGITFNELIIKLGITKQSLNRVLRDLINSKMIKQIKDESDTRKKNLFLDKEGKVFFETVYNSQKKRIFNALKNSNSDSVIKFKEVLKRIVDGK